MKAFKELIDDLAEDLKQGSREAIADARIDMLNTFAAKITENIDDKIDFERRDHKFYGVDPDGIIEALETVKDTVEILRWLMEERIKNEQW